MVVVVGRVASSFESWLSFGDCGEDDDDGIGDIVGDDGDYGEKKRKIRGHENVDADDIGFFSLQVLMLALLVLWWWL